ncbi:MAG: DUF1844 domain-containing protein [Acidobacteriota bacterium]|nr:DUF1844 domain-containing protein [Acidobacteriota bacterium]
MAEENLNEEPVFKIADRRKFNADGSLRDGVKLEETKSQIETASASAGVAQSAPQAEPVEQPQIIHEEPRQTESVPETVEETDDEINEAEIPGAENPASFANFLLSLASQAAAAMGLAENPMTGKRTADLELSRYWLDVLGMLHDKTKGNLHPQEQKLFDGLLGDLRMQFVQLRRMAEAQMRKQEENLMKQAAQKFSGKDILGK